MYKMKKTKAKYIIPIMMLSALLSGCGNAPYANRPEVPPVRPERTEQFEENQEADADETQEEKSPIDEQLEQLLGLMEATGNQKEIMDLLAEESWYSAFLPENGSGSSTYKSEDSMGNMTLTVTVGYEQAGNIFVRVWYPYGENHIQYLERTETALRIADMSVADGLYQGGFDIWLCRADNALLYHEKGTFVNGICVGDYIAQVYQGEEPTDLMELWNERETLELKSFRGSFTEEGIIETRQPGGMEAAVALACDEIKKEYLTAATQVEAQELVFGCSHLGLKAYPGIAAAENADVGQNNQEGMDVYESRSVIEAKQTPVRQNPGTAENNHADNVNIGTVSGSN